MRKLILAIPSGIPSVIMIALVSYFSLTDNPVGATISLFPGSDKVVHFIMYFVTTTTFIYDYTKLKFPHYTVLSKEILITFIAATMGLLMECGQLALSNHRCFEALDIVANTVGAFTAFGVSKFFLIHRFRKFFGRKHHHHHHHHHHHSKQ